MTMNAQQKIIPDPTKKVCIVSRHEIPPLEIKRDGKIDPSGELRIFHANETLGSILQPPSDFSMAWASLGEGEEIPPHTHDTTTILIVYKGSGRLLVEDKREFFEGDCIVIPPYCEAGFVGGVGGCHGISIEVGKGKAP
jgi:quercetin dioxygenase-like cupin family protein